MFCCPRSISGVWGISPAVPLAKEPLNILLAEDNPDDIFFFRSAYKKAALAGTFNAVCDGMEVQAYLNGEEAFGDRTLYPFPDVLLLDLNMPRINGFEVLEWIRENPKFSCLIVHVLSYSSREADIERVYALHANSYVVKPSRVDKLVEFITALDRWHHFVSLPTRMNCAKFEPAHSAH
jgi:CheY-like chemotaxis protein